MLVCERYFRIGRWRGIVEKFRNYETKPIQKSNSLQIYKGIIITSFSLTILSVSKVPKSIKPVQFNASVLSFVFQVFSYSNFSSQV